MFDDIKQNQGQPAANGSPPSNLPGNIPPSPAVTLQSEPEDILAGIDRGMPPPPPAFKPIAPQEKIGLDPQDLGEFKSSSKRGPLIAIIVIVVLVVAGGGWFGWRYFLRSAAEKTPVEEISNEEAGGTEAVKEEEGLPEEAATEPESAEELVMPKDTDQDGLSDEEENFYGTDPTLVDTDNDGLSDKFEKNVYLTDPLDADTDDDGYPDGQEVKNGYDPKGPGKLLELP